MDDEEARLLARMKEKSVENTWAGYEEKRDPGHPGRHQRCRLAWQCSREARIYEEHWLQICFSSKSGCVEGSKYDLV